MAFAQDKSDRLHGMQPSKGPSSGENLALYYISLLDFLGERIETDFVHKPSKLVNVRRGVDDMMLQFFRALDKKPSTAGHT